MKKDGKRSTDAKSIPVPPPSQGFLGDNQCHSSPWRARIESKATKPEVWVQLLRPPLTPEVSKTLAKLQGWFMLLFLPLSSPSVNFIKGRGSSDLGKHPKHAAYPTTLLQRYGAMASVQGRGRNGCCSSAGIQPPQRVTRELEGQAGCLARPESAPSFPF